jgi:SanA protein
MLSFIVRVIKWAVILAVLAILFAFLLDRTISYTMGKYIYTEIKDVPKRKAALVLGTAKYVAKGKKNYFYVYRIRAAAALWKAGKVDAIVVSGDNETKYYNETARMYKDLIKEGVPKRYITSDHAGLRTLDSVVRAEAIFDLEEYIIVSQKFHLERALFIARAKGQKPIGFAAKDIAGTKAANKMLFREYLARTKAFLDVYILQTEPKFYGKKEKVQYKK